MKTDNVYDIIKRRNGEKFAKAVRNYDNGIFDIPNIDQIVRYAGRDAEPIMEYLISLKKIKISETVQPKSPFELLNAAGYDAEYADTLEKQNSIKQYFADGERLCTFHDDARYKDYYIINAVKYNVDEILRQDFEIPDRQDEYGTSVISIQVRKSGGFISIKNRYNHRVENCDNTFDSNPDNIIYGLSAAIKAYFNVDFSSQKVQLPYGYVQMDGKIIKYNYEIDNIYFGSDFYINARDGVIYELDKMKEVMLDWFIYHTAKKTLRTPVKDDDAFTDVFNTETQGQKIELLKDSNGKHLLVNGQSAILLDDDSCISRLNILCAETIGHGILDYNRNNATTIHIHSGAKYIGARGWTRRRGIEFTPPVLPHGTPNKYTKIRSGLPLRVARFEEKLIGPGIVRDNRKINWMCILPGKGQSWDITLKNDHGYPYIHHVRSGSADCFTPSMDRVSRKFLEEYNIPIKVYSIMCAGTAEDEEWYYRACPPELRNDGLGLVWKVRAAFGDEMIIDDSDLIWKAHYKNIESRLDGAYNIVEQLHNGAFNFFDVFGHAFEPCVQRYRLWKENREK